MTHDDGMGRSYARGPKVRAFVYPASDGFCILYTDAGEPYDHADGFEDEIDAVNAAHRGVYGIGTVHIARPWEGLQ